MIAVLCPSRGRPDRFREMVDVIAQTARTHVAIYAGLDLDDPRRGDYLHAGVSVVLCGRLAYPGVKLNALAAHALRDGCDILASFGDDHRPRTDGWDERVHEAMAGLGSGLVYCADGLQNERLPTAPFWSADVIRALGWYSPPPLRHLYQDNYWLRLANDLRRRAYLPDVLIEHLHPSAGKAPADEQNARVDSWYEHDRAAFDAFLADAHAGALARVRAAL